MIGASIRDTEGHWIPGGVAEPLLHGADTPVAIAPDGFAERGSERIGRIGAGLVDAPDGHAALQEAAR